jgi:hypothetical protein
VVWFRVMSNECSEPFMLMLCQDLFCMQSHSSADSEKVRFYMLLSYFECTHNDMHFAFHVLQPTSDKKVPCS